MARGKKKKGGRNFTYLAQMKRLRGERGPAHTSLRQMGKGKDPRLLPDKKAGKRGEKGPLGVK